MARVLGRQLDILGSSLPKLHSFSHSLPSLLLLFFYETSPSNIPKPDLVHFSAFPPLKLIVVFIFFSTAIFNSASQASFCLFVSDLEWCNVLPF